MFDWLFEEDPKAEIIDEIIALELENLFDYSEARAKKIKELRDQIQYYDEVIPQ